jgi:CHAD domain-containing protein
MAKKNAKRLPAAVGATAGAIAAGGAVAGKLVHDRGARREARRRRYRLHPGEAPADGVRRIARGQIDNGIDQLDGGGDVGEAIHEVRKGFKRLRALVRVVRDELGDDVYRRENTAFRDAGRELSATRDAQVLVETLDDLARRYERETPERAFHGLRKELAAEEASAHERVENDASAVEGVRAALESARTRIATWPLREDRGYRLLAPGFRRIYRRGRRALRAAEAQPTDERLHELRKRAKDTWHAAQIARPAAPKEMKKLARRAHELSDLAGADHDLAVLREAARARARSLRPGELVLLEALIRRRRRRLQREAFALGRRVYGRKPRKVAGAIAGGAVAGRDG